jgi:TetR/AcrR family transcriptional regulator, transcriptional repressor of bet genes
MPRQKASEEHRREAILRAAYEVAARHGVEALTVRAVAARAAVSHGTVLFHFKRRDELVSLLLDRVLDATALLRVPNTLDRLTRPTERMEALLRAEMDRLSRDPRTFRLFLEYWTLGVRSAPIRRKVSAALDRYRGAFQTIAEGVPDGVAGVAVSLVHGCALQALIDPTGFGIEQHLDAAARLLERLATPQVDAA